MSLTKVTYSMQAGSLANVLDFGADSTGAADSTDAIQNALNSPAIAVKIPSGAYRVNGTLTIPDGKSLIGDSSGGLFLFTATTTTGTILFKDSSSSAGPIVILKTTSTLSGIQFRHAKTNGATTGVIQIGNGVNAAVYNDINDCSIFGHLTNDRTGSNTCFGIYMFPSPVAEPVYWNRINNLQITNTDVAVKLNEQSNANHIANTIVKEAHIAFWLDGGSSECIDNIFSGCGAYNGLSKSPDPIVVKTTNTVKYNVFGISSEFFGKTLEIDASSEDNMFIGQFNELVTSNPGVSNQLISPTKNNFSGQNTFTRDLSTADEVITVHGANADGTLVKFTKNGVLHGEISTKDTDIAIGTNDTAIRFIDGSDAITPHDLTTNSARSGFIDLGTSGATYKDVHISGKYYLSTSSFLYRSSGSPEGSITAAIGSLYTRSDGGAGTTLYVKESGTGNTGWIAK